MLQFHGRILKTFLVGISMLGASFASATPTNLIATNDATSLYYQFNYTGSPTYLRYFIDKDSNSATGYSTNSIGADYLIENGSLYSYSGTGSNWSWTWIKTISWTAASGLVQASLAKTDISSPSSFKLFGQSDSTNSSTSTVTVSTISTATYTANNSLITNPERGMFWMTDCRANPVSVTTLQGYRSTDGHSVFYCNWYLRDFKTSAISSTVLAQLQTQLDNIRTAGFKTVLRFAYTDTDTNDASVTTVLSHLDQLAPYLTNNADVITSVEVGLIGQWGEMQASSNFGTPSTSTDWANRKSVVDKL